DSTIPHDRGRDPVPAGWSEARVPGRLAIIVGMDVDKARRHELASGVDLDQAGTRHLAEACNSALGYRHISFVGRATSVIGAGCAADDEVVTVGHPNLLW